MVNEKVAGRQDLNAESGYGSKVLYVMRDDRVRLAGNSDLRNHVVIGITQQWSPEEKDPLLGANEAQIVKECGNVPVASRGLGMTQKNRLILNDQWNGQRYRERLISQLL